MESEENKQVSSTGLGISTVPAPYLPCPSPALSVKDQEALIDL
jgi:hypothetical protein